MISSNRDYHYYSNDRYSGSLSAQGNAWTNVDDLEPFEMFNIDSKSKLDDNDDDISTFTTTAPPGDKRSAIATGQLWPSIHPTAAATLWSRSAFSSGAWVQDQMFGPGPTASGFGQVLSASNDTLLVGADGNGE